MGDIFRNTSAQMNSKNGGFVGSGVHSLKLAVAAVHLMYPYSSRTHSENDLKGSSNPMFAMLVGISLTDLSGSPVLSFIQTSCSDCIKLQNVVKFRASFEKSRCGQMYRVDAGAFDSSTARERWWWSVMKRVPSGPMTAGITWSGCSDVSIERACQNAIRCNLKSEHGTQSRAPSSSVLPAVIPRWVVLESNTHTHLALALQVRCLLLARLSVKVRRLATHKQHAKARLRRP